MPRTPQPCQYCPTRQLTWMTATRRHMRICPECQTTQPVLPQPTLKQLAQDPLLSFMTNAQLIYLSKQSEDYQMEILDYIQEMGGAPSHLKRRWLNNFIFFAE